MQCLRQNLKNSQEMAQNVKARPAGMIPGGTGLFYFSSPWIRITRMSTGSTNWK